MRLIFDQNISFRVVPKVLNILPDSIHVRTLNLENTEDGSIWQYAKKNGDAIITFDQDFSELAMVRGTPPKIIWLRLNNPSNEEVATFIKDNLIIIKAYLNESYYIDLDYLELE